ncbi:MAG: HAMP domain-containing sensor histidine kinase [Kofleriaceae bacterium]
MRLPAFVEELRHPSFHGRLLAGCHSGYLIAAAFAVLATAAVGFGLVPHGREFVALLIIKATTNTLALVALRRRWRFAVECMGLNTAADIVCMTAAVHLTGGVQSPLVAIYVIEVAVVALLSNLGVTLMVASGILLAFGAMGVLEVAGVLTPTPPAFTGPLTALKVAVAVGFAAVAIGIPTFFTAAILRRLRTRERQLEDRTAELLEAGQQQSVFLASVTHELRTPIHGISGLAELIASGVYGPTTDRQRQAATRIGHSAQGLVQLVDDLLALVRAEVGRVEPHPTRFEAAELVEQVCGSVAWMAETKGVTVAPAATAGEVCGDRRLLGHILVNLVANAIKFTPAGGHVTVTAATAGGALTLAVTDTGIGIPAHQRATIFEPFRQVDGGDLRNFGGVGLGLALVDRLATVLGGRVEVASEVNVGSTFTVTVPLAAAPAGSGGPGDGGELAAEGQPVEPA